VPGGFVETLRSGALRRPEDVVTMTVEMPLKKKYCAPGKCKHVTAQNHSGTTVHKRRTIDQRKRTGTGRDWYR
jgi:hypothetical protein